MTNRRLALTLGLSALCTGALLSVPASRAADDEKPATAQKAVEKQADDEPSDDGDDRSAVTGFMRAKLAASQSVLEGLVTEDFGEIKEGAQRMVLMSRAAEWQVIHGPVYAQFSSEFRRTCQDLVKAADEKNIDRAGFAYMRLTMGCISCHNYVRTTKVAGDQPLPRELTPASFTPER